MNKILKFTRTDKFFTALILPMLCCFHAPAFAGLCEGKL
jgi:hypothetical protein